MEVIESEDGLPTKLLSALVADERGRLWVGTYGAGLQRIDRERRIETIETPCGRSLLSLAWIAPDTLWIGGEAGLCRWRGDAVDHVLTDDILLALAPGPARSLWVAGHKWVRQLVDGEVVLSLERFDRAHPRHLFALVDDGAGGAWIGSDEGLWQARPEGIRRIETQGPVTALVPAGDDAALWFLQRDKLVLRDNEGRRAALMSEPGAWAVWLDGEGRLWLIGSEGHAYVDERALREALRSGATPPRFERIGRGGQDGARATGIGTPQVAALPGGATAYVAHGEVRFGHLRPVMRSSVAPQPQVLAVTDASRASVADGQELAAHALPLDLHCTAASLRDPGALRFRHRLWPLDAGWSLPSPQRSLSFGRLPPGGYVFEVEARLADTKPAQPTRFAFTVLPQWHETAWARVGSALAAILLVAAATALALRLRFRRLAARQLQLEELVAARTVELERANRQLDQLARTDALTGLANRRRFMQDLAQEWRRCQRDGTSLAVLMVDVDYFKAYNDRYGHAAGDEALRRIAGALAASVHRAGELVARYGGEEFIALLPHTDSAGAAAVAESMRAAVAAMGIEHLGRVDDRVATVSIGVAASLPVGAEPEALLARADAALYQAKREGRARVVVAI